MAPLGVGIGLFFWSSIIIALIFRIIKKTNKYDNTIVKISATVAVIVVIGLSLFESKQRETKKKDTDRLFKAMMPALLESCRTTAASSVTGHRVPREKKLLWLDLSSVEIADSWHDLNDAMRAKTPEDMQLLCCSTAEKSLVGSYSGGSGEAFEWKIEAWLIDFKTKEVLARKEFHGDKPPQQHSVKRGEVRNEYGSSPIPEVVSWLEGL